LPSLAAAFEIPLRWDLTAHTQNVRWQAFRRKRDIVPGTMPQILTLTEQVMNRKRLIGVQPKRTEIQFNPARLRADAIKIDDDDDNIERSSVVLL